MNRTQKALRTDDPASSFAGLLWFGMKEGNRMLFLFSHLWLPYVLSLALILIALLFGLGSPEVLLYAAVGNLIPLLGLWCIRSGYMLPAVIIAVLCCAVLFAAAWGFRKAAACCDRKMTACGALSVVIAVIITVLCCFSSGGQIMQTVLAVCCLSGMLSVVYILWWLSEFGKGMGSP